MFLQLAIIHIAAVNIYVLIFVCTCFYFSWVYTWSGIAGSYGNTLCLTFCATARLFSKAAVSVYIPTGRACGKYILFIHLGKKTLSGLYKFNMMFCTEAILFVIIYLKFLIPSVIILLFLMSTCLTYFIYFIFLILKIFYCLCYYNCPNFPLGLPQPAAPHFFQAIPKMLSTFMGHAYMFFG